ncbi:MAG: baseplate assembly protein [Sphingomonadales bacterium]|nr:baseplate assembly protein [Sphingomonadales bacterium]
MSETYPGLYRGTVIGNVDPMQLGRLQVQVPGVQGQSELSWAAPCAPFGGKNGIGGFCLPPVGANVWVMFENGSPADPVWMGTFWSSQEIPPASPAIEQTRIFKTDGIQVKLDDIPGAAMLEIKMASGAKLTLGPSGIEIDNGQGAKIALSGPQVSVNSGALEVI